MDKREFKDLVYKEIAQVAKGLSNPHRMEIFDLLSNGEKTVEVIAREINISFANASQHLQTLKTLRLVKTRKKGTFIFYSVINGSFIKVWQEIRNYVLKHNSEVIRLIEDFKRNKGFLANLSIGELERDQLKKYFIIDVRPEEEYRQGHLPNAISVPLKNLGRQMKTLSKNKRILVYCRGPLCLFADEAVRNLNQKGFKASRIYEGYPDLMIES